MIPDDTASLTNVLKALRSARGLSLADTAKLLEEEGIHMSRSGIHHWEMGRVRPPLPMIHALAKVYKLDSGEQIRLYQAAGYLVTLHPGNAA